MLEDRYLKIIKDILDNHSELDKHSVFIFGSRAMGNAHKFSDVDIGIKGDRPIEYSVITRLVDDFEESDLPFRVDVVDFSKTDEKFRSVAEKATIPLN
jgi:type I restriction enzyme S subunit